MGFWKKTGSKDRRSSFKVSLRGKDNAALSYGDLRQGLYELAWQLARYNNYRFRWVSLYFTMVDEHGNEVRINDKGEWVLYPYQSAADEHDR